MLFFRNRTAVLIVGLLIAGVAVILWRAIMTEPLDKGVDVVVPQLSGVASAGKVAFDTNCAECHGQNASGTDKGPPLVHDLYNPGHHGDGTFVLAARQGVRQHHWRFGNMPQRPGLSDAKMTAIIRYVRELQVANGITYKPHSM